MLIGDQWAVALDGLTKRYPGGGPDAVAGVTLKLAPGQVLGLLGPNGSGKSTTLKLLAGLIRPSAGAARLMGHPVGSTAARAITGYLPESLQLATHQSGREFLQYCAGLSSLSADQAARRIASVLAWTGLGKAADQRVATYSKGMRQRLGLAQAVLHEPEVLLLDEPISGLDPAGRQALGRLIREQAEQGRAVVLTSHLMAQAEELCDRLALLGGGRLLVCGTVNELLGPVERTAPGPTRLEQLYLDHVHARR